MEARAKVIARVAELYRERQEELARLIATEMGKPLARFAAPNLILSNEQVAEVIADDRVQGVSLTGSERAGSAVAEVAGRNLKKYVLELGGSDPFIVVDSDDLDAAVKAAVSGRMGNAGQACTASKRFIILEDLYEAFVEKFTARMSAIKPGDPLLADTRFGPLSSQSAADGLIEQIQDAVDKGAPPADRRTPHRDGPGAYVEPTVLTDVAPGTRALLANGSPYGLGGAVFSADTGKAKEVADRLDTRQHPAGSRGRMGAAHPPPTASPRSLVLTQDESQHTYGSGRGDDGQTKQPGNEDCPAVSTQCDVRRPGQAQAGSP